MRAGLRKYVLLGMMMTGVPGSVWAIYGTGEETQPVRGEVMAVEELPVAEPTVEPTAEPTIVPTVTPTLTAVPTPTVTPDPWPTQPAATQPGGQAPTPDVWSPAELEPLFIRYANEYGVDKNVLERLANCESHFNPSASNGPYLGMFQFDVNTWQKYRRMMGQDPNADLRLSAEESIKTAAFVIQQSGTGLWPRCL